MNKLHEIMGKSMESQPRRGRPPVPADQRQAERFDMRMSAAQRAKLKAMGGADWVRDKIDEAPEPSRDK